MGRLVHLLRSDDPDVQFCILSAARKRLAEGGAGRISYTFPPIIMQTFRLAKRFYDARDKVSGGIWALIEKDVSEILSLDP